MVMQPGQTITPSGSGDNPSDTTVIQPPQAPEQATTTQNIASAIESVPEPVVNTAAANTNEETTNLDESPSDTQSSQTSDSNTAGGQQEDYGTSFDGGDDGVMDNSTPLPANGVIEWTASEYIDHEKRKSWFVILFIVSVAVLAAIFFISGGDKFTMAVVAVVAVLFGVVAAKKPRTLGYKISPQGIQIDQKVLPYDNFRSFTIIDTTAVHSVQLQSLQRFTPPISIYYPPEMEDSIVRSLGDHIPYEDRKLDIIDRIMSSIRF